MTPGGQHQFLDNSYQRTLTLALQRADSPVASLSANSAEHFFQAAKTLSPTEERKVLEAQASADAKRLGGQVGLWPDWEQVKLRAMAEIQRSKFSDPDLLEWPLEAINTEIIEPHDWHDVVRGACTCGRLLGQIENHLGRMLMELRHEIREDNADRLRRQRPTATVENGF